MSLRDINKEWNLTMSRILPSQLTEEEILALLDSDDVSEEKAEIFDYTDDIVPFLSFYNITPGVTPVSKRLLYRLYRTYSKQPLDQNEFNIQVGRFVAGVGYIYNINMDNFAISNHIYKAEKTRDKTKSLTYQKHFDWFLKVRKMERGVTWVEGFVLFFIYKDFCKSRRVVPKFGYVNFHKFLKLHFQFRRVKENRSLWFRVDHKTAVIFNEEEQNVIRNARTKSKEKRGSSQDNLKSETEETKTE